jgi:cytochrome c biogenesis protein CcmG/thiol:disulfide interchange protein DsbE
VKQNADRVLVGLVVVLAGILVFVVSGTLDQHVTVPGDTAPDFRVLTTRGRTISPVAFPGKVLVLNFWASWCPPCIEEAPSLNAFADQMGPKGVTVVGISIDRNEASYQKFLSKYGVSFDTYDDPDADVSTSYGTFQIPETYIIDKSGKVVEKIISNQNFMDPDFLDHINKML